MKNTTGTSYTSGTSDTSSWTQKIPTNELRWFWKKDEMSERYWVLQQKWEIVIFKNHVADSISYEWRDVPRVTEYD